MRSKVVASTSISTDATENEIVEEVLSLGLNAERTMEKKKTELLMTRSAKRQNAVAGLQATLDALNSNRVHELVYSEGCFTSGGICHQCESVFPSDTVDCPFCGQRVEPADDLMEAAIAKALAEDAGIEQLRGEAADRLKTIGGIGAFLRY
jgi:peptide subunit release factor 1 (eRF1)